MREVLIETQNIPALERETALLKVFDKLEVGESITIVNNRDPQPLIKQFEKNRPMQFDSTYLEKGPKSWLIKLTKNRKSGECPL